MLYIKENDKPNFWVKNLKLIKMQDNSLIIPIMKDEKYDEKIANKLIKTIRKNTNSTKIILSKKLIKEEIIVNKLNSNGMKIMDGKRLSEILILDMTKYIIDKRKMQNPRISVLINDLTDLEYENIKQLALKYKKVNIITNHREKFKNLEEHLSNDLGIEIVIENNKRKSLLKTDIILNIDFPEEFINKYMINENAVILSIKENIRITRKRFNGLVIKDYEITFMQDRQIDKENFYLKDIYEAKIYKKSLKEIKVLLRVDNVKIEKLILNNGSI